MKNCKIITEQKNVNGNSLKGLRIQEITVLLLQLKVFGGGHYLWEGGNRLCDSDGCIKFLVKIW